MSRGLSNRNPGNIRQSAVRYKGEVRPSRDPAFKQFESMPWGYRAIFVLLDTYRIRHGLDTIRGMISRWAPPSENRTEAYIRAVADDIAGRCVKCYEMRLFEAARMAKEGGFDAFTSSLFISPYQQHELMRDVAYRAGEAYGVQFYYQDFRPLFRDGQTRARELGFYIQKYCGCIFSEQERYQKPSRIIP